MFVGRGGCVSRMEGGKVCTVFSVVFVVVGVRDGCVFFMEI